MKLFKFRKNYNYTEIILFGVKISHKRKVLNKFISLGTNCFPRMKLNQFKIKPSKCMGELSCPFDLCLTPLDSVRKILENDFADYFDDLYFDEEQKIWKNEKYNISYLHDKLSKEEFIKRYSQRIKNFRDITKSQKNIIFVQSLFNNSFNKNIRDDISAINNILKKYCKNPYKYRIINLKHDKTKPITTKIKIASNAYYFECLSPYDKNWTQWWTEDTDNKPAVKPLIENCIKQIYK